MRPVSNALRILVRLTSCNFSGLLPPQEGPLHPYSECAQLCLQPPERLSRLRFAPRLHLPASTKPFLSAKSPAAPVLLSGDLTINIRVSAWLPSHRLKRVTLSCLPYSSQFLDFHGSPAALFIL